MSSPDHETAPHISIVVPTRNRSGDLRNCLESLAQVEYPRWEVIVVDQSADLESLEVGKELADRLPGFLYIRTTSNGAAVARNIGANHAGGELIAFLDDDCTVGSGFLEDLAAVFARHPRAGLIFGRVTACKYDKTKFLLPTREIKVEAVLDRKSWREMWLHRVIVMSANMSLRRLTWDGMGGFDEMLGAGAPGRSAEDLDYAYRALLAGIPVVMTPEVTVIHHGVRPHAGGSASRLIRNTAFGTGVAHMKLLRGGHPAAIALFLATIVRFAGWIELNTLVRDGREFGGAWLAFYLVGLARSFGYRIDRRRMTYVPDANEAPGPRLDDLVIRGQTARSTAQPMGLESEASVIRAAM